MRSISHQFNLKRARRMIPPSLSAPAFTALPTSNTALRRPTTRNIPTTFNPYSPAITPMRYSTSSTRLMAGPSSALHSLTELLTTPVRVAIPVAGVVTLLALFKYRTAVQKRLRQVKEESWVFGAGVTMERIKNADEKEKTDMNVFDNLRLLELNPDFKARYEREGWQLQSLGDYMASLRPKNMPRKMSMEKLPKLIQREIEAGLAMGLLKGLGPNLGLALLPAVGVGPVKATAQKLAATIATKWFLDPDSAMSASKDKAGVPISLMTLLSLSDINAKVNSGSESNDNAADEKQEAPATLPMMNLTAMEKMKAGEAVKAESFTELISDEFDVSRDFDNIIRMMEAELSKTDCDDCMDTTEMKMAQEDLREYNDMDMDEEQEGEEKQEPSSKNYDPEDRRMGTPVPINPRLFPDLHLGWGDAKCSHTKREVLKMRLLSVLLNKLGANYHRRMDGDSQLFTVRMSPSAQPLTKPGEFIQALMDAGHDVAVVPSSRLTTFGLGMCVSEEDGSWTNIPLGVFIESGYEDRRGRMAPAMMPHSGLDMYIKGPLAGKRADGTPSELAIQHFIGIEGFCGWKSHANAEVPFNEAIPTGSRLTGENAVRAARLAGLYGIVLNGLATDLNLPFGGYGTTAVCNDSAAIVQQCIYGENTIYPMTSIGRFMQRTMRYAQDTGDKLAKLDEMKDERKDMSDIVRAMKCIPSDINASPSNAASAAERLLHTLQPKVPFLLMKDSKDVMESILEEENEDGEFGNEQGTPVANGDRLASMIR